MNAKNLEMLAKTLGALGLGAIAANKFGKQALNNGFGYNKNKLNYGPIT